MISNKIQVLVIFLMMVCGTGIRAQQEVKSKLELFKEKRKKEKAELIRKKRGEKGEIYEKGGVSYLKYRWREDLPQQEITSTMHRNNIGKILFSNEKIPLKNEDPSKIKSQLTSGDHIYGRMYLISSIPNDTIYLSDDASTSDPREVTRGNRFHNTANAGYNLYINGELSDWRIENAVFDSETLHQTTRQVWLVPKPEDEPVSNYWFDELDKLPDGSHNIRIEYVPLHKSIIRPLAVGEFTFIKDSKNIISTGRTFSGLPEGRKDSGLASEAMAILKKVYNEKGWDGTLQKVKFKSDWVSSYVGSYDKLRKIREITVYAYTTHDNGKCMVEEFVIGQNHNGSTFSGPYFYSKVNPSSKLRVDCD